MSERSILYDNAEVARIVQAVIRAQFRADPDIRRVFGPLQYDIPGLGDGTAAELAFALFLLISEQGVMVRRNGGRP